MVGHTGDIDATVVACKAADIGVKVICLLPLNCGIFILHEYLYMHKIDHGLVPSGSAVNSSIPSSYCMT